MKSVVETSRYRFQVIHTPGHSPDHICLYEPGEGWLFCGDAYVGGKDRALRADYNIWQIIHSLKDVLRLDLQLLFTGSGSVRENPRAAIAEKVAYLEETAGQALALHAEGLDYAEIRRALFGRELPIAYMTLGHFSGKHLVRSFIEDREEG